MRSGLRCLLLFGVVPLMLAACDSTTDEPLSESQKYYFLESLKQVEAGGRQLQSPELGAQALGEALNTLDQGLRLGFQVERAFLDRLDLRLGKNFERYFIKGVENYRLGIEAGDEDQQLQGLALLAQWSQFWTAEQAAILARLHSG